ncbi:putative TIR domain, winged helix-turn-helix DNA-binding domain-containing protein [Medicago truncatula]|uniref:Putative TIR domain, winged helix-turn-helix DNA-binding domain-containing protein n=1 Tax=Medicago truncatula TaxID=3880 RepID=A0A396HZE7_MEDTR|nr:disease resistance-like protein DSC1 isoform X2 [Medicago truncatula]RHN58716.1 putative TIR domain, winged helix-turn-helix DNA-binding domain-containing protein [Medicago truncatula]
MAHLSSGASSIIYATQYRDSGSKAFPAGIVARKSKFEMRPLWDSGINHRISKHQLSTWTIAGVKKKESVNNIVTKGVGEKSMSTNAPQSKYDVFVSFRGKDIRDGFLGHLVKAFRQKKINVFVDNIIKRGDEIKHSLVEAIEGSLISLVIFSKNYSSSHWCLDELVKIIECKKDRGQIIIPVFYGVRSKIVLDELEKKDNFSKVEDWKLALKKSTDVAGIRLSEFRNDAELLEEITNVVLMRLKMLSKHPVNSKGLIGIDKSIAHLNSLLKKESQKVRVIGIWGMPGIGKTTIAEEIFNQNRSEYDGCCFLAKVSEKLKLHGIESLKETLFTKILAEDVKIDTPNRLSSDIERRIGRMKVLIILDDVKDEDQLEMLFETLDWFQSDSRIILTARDKQVLFDNEVDDDDRYEVGVLDSSDALALFNLNAFKQSHLETEFDEISKRVVNYAKGNPLVLKVLAHMLRGKNKEVWESQLDKLKRLPVKKVHDVVKLSYDDLDRLEKKYFLDIACFFNGLSLKVDYMKLLLKDCEGDNSVAVGIERLKDKALITISEDNVISMHDILQEMGREVVRQESSEYPNKRSRLWDHDEICDVLKNDKGTDAIRSICLNLSAIRKLKLSPDVFAKMTNLKFLDFYGGYNHDCLDLLPQGLQPFPTDLRYLHWVHYPLESLPKKFSAEKLVILDLSYSLVEKLWCGVQDLINLKEVTLSFSEDLKELPDFSKAINLKVLNIQRCYMLTSVHPSIFSLDKLENIVELDLSRCPINALPSSFGCQSKLETLVLRGTQIESIPSSIKDLTRLRKLDISDCSELLALPELPSSLETLLVDCVSLKSVFFPSTVAEQLKENKKRIEFWNCFKLDERSLINIGLNLQINLMEFAYQHLSTLEHDKVESYVDYKDILDSYQAVYVYPGSSVPEWLEYKTTKNDMIVDLSPPHLSPLLGFVFCFILAEDSKYCDIMEFNISTFDGEGDGEKDGVDIYMYRTCCYTELDHVCMIYDQPCSHYLTSIAKSQTQVKIKVTARTIGNKFRERTEVKLKGFGISPISHTIYDNFVEQMELFDRINKWKRTVLLSIILCISLLQLKMKTKMKMKKLI